MLNHSAELLGYIKKGLKVTHTVVSKTSGKMLFYNGGLKEGIDNLGLENLGGMNKKLRDSDCEHVPVFSLNNLIETHVKVDKTDPISIFSIDVEGFYADVLVGTTADILKIVENIEFEYNWMRLWKNLHLFDVTKMLDEIADMTCYWAGTDRLWRITKCWMTYFDIDAWSNVACVNRRLEEFFQSTLEGKRQ